MSKTFEINGKTYKAAPFNYNLMCEFEERGLPIEQINEKPFLFIRTYFAVSGRFKNASLAGKELEDHIEKGGDFADIMEAMNDAMESSGFFQMLTNNQTKENLEDKDED